MTWLSSLLAIALTGGSIIHALPSAHEDLPWNINNKRHDGLPWNINNKRGDLGAPIGNCSASIELPAAAPKENIWAGLTQDEVSGLLTYIHDPAQGLNLTVYPEAGPWDNHVTVTEAVCASAPF
jgi:primary-amine oxidase